jgi:hypothetical protein
MRRGLILTDEPAKEAGGGFLPVGYSNEKYPEVDEVGNRVGLVRVRRCQETRIYCGSHD